MTPHLAGTPVLTTERLTLRAPEGRDWPAWAEFMATDRARHVGGPVAADKAWRAFGHVIGHWAMRGFGSLVFTERNGDAALGMAGPWFPEGWPEHEIGWTVWSAAHEGAGLAREAAQAARAYAYDTLGWTTAVSYIEPGNARSVALAERLGAWREDQAPTPRGEPCLVYRHPGPEALQ